MEPRDLEIARLEWQDDTPYSPRSDDIYHSKDGGLEETRHVFLRGSGLPDRWQDRERFVIGETGFGTGLNFLVTWQAWRAQSHAPRLHFVSVEKHPFAPADLARALEPWTELRELSAALLERYPPLTPGFHPVELEGGRVRLLLLFGDARDVLPDLEAEVDAWYLDGFAPSRNPDLWSDEVLTEVGRLTRPGGTLATYTVAGRVRRALETQGFRIDRPPGFGSKREMLRGHKAGVPSDAPEVSSAAVIGGGLAGTAAARSLEARGVPVTLFEAEAGLARGASGNAVGLYRPDLNKTITPRERFYSAAAGLTRGRAIDLPATDRGLEGSVYPAVSDEIRQRHDELRAIRTVDPTLARWIEADEATELAGVPLRTPALFHPMGGWVNPGSLCQVETPRLGNRVMDIERIQVGWRLIGEHGVLGQAAVVILANARDALRLGVTRHLPLRTVRGQVTVFAPAIPELRRPLVYGGYLTPARGGEQLLGSTFQPKDVDLEPRDEDDSENLQALEECLPELARRLRGHWVKSRVGVRTTTPDQLPVVGALPDRRTRTEEGLPENTEGLYASLAHGSRGVISSQLAGELLAAEILGEPRPADRAVRRALDPSRFLDRAARRSGESTLRGDRRRG